MRRKIYRPGDWITVGGVQYHVDQVTLHNPTATRDGWQTTQVVTATTGAGESVTVEFVTHRRTWGSQGRHADDDDGP